MKPKLQPMPVCVWEHHKIVAADRSVGDAPWEKSSDEECATDQPAEQQLVANSHESHLDYATFSGFH
jgi:hypothetical protein